MRVIAFDTETHLLGPGLLAPPLVCLQWARPGEPPQLTHRDDTARVRVEQWLAGDEILVGHNVAYDMAVIAAQWPQLLPAIFAKYDRGQVTDTKIREQLVMIARGTFRSQEGADGDLYPVNYDLASCVHRHLNHCMPKDGWRMFYRAFDQTPDVQDWPRVATEFQEVWRRGERPEWTQGIEAKDVDAMLAAGPDEAVRYALDDARWTLALYESQEKHFAPLLRDQYRQSRAAFALHLSSCWGLYTDPEAVDKLEGQLREDFDRLQRELYAEGIVRADGTADTKAAQAAMTQACAEESFPILGTKGGAVSLSSEACGRFDETSLIGQYSHYLQLRKTLSNDIKMLRAGCDVPIQPRYDLADTGRTRCSKPNIQAINRGAGIREAFRPRPGTAFIQADFEGLELHTLAAWCLEKIGWSRLAEALNAGVDVHTSMAAEMLGLSYDDALVRKKSGDKVIKEYRQRAKAINFGYPGGLGIKKFVRYARASYGVEVSEAEAKQYKNAWMRRFPEMVDYFRLAAQATTGANNLGSEEHLFTGRYRGNVRYSALCNGRFQGLGADAAKEALWRVTRACYVEEGSTLYGCRVVAFVHDEIICESALDRAPAAAKELGKVMCEGANIYLSKVPVRAEPVIMRKWSKAAEPVYDAAGQLVPWGDDD